MRNHLRFTNTNGNENSESMENENYLRFTNENLKTNEKWKWNTEYKWKSVLQMKKQMKNGNEKPTIKPSFTGGISITKTLLRK